jgi:prepilin-type N-terminal cleavage/methylation domain-containing protein
MKARSQQGYTLLELMIIVGIIGIFAAIALPAYNGLLNRWRATAARDKIHTALQETKACAKRTKTVCRLSIRQTPNQIEYAVNLDSQNPVWQRLSTDAHIDPSSTFLLQGGTYMMHFNYRGVSHGQLGTMTVQAGQAKRCVVVSTLLGAIRVGQPRRVSGERNPQCL